jgi:cytochrome P450
MSATEECTREWRDGEVRDIHRDMVNISVKVICKIIFGHDYELERKDLTSQIHEAMDVFNAGYDLIDFVPFISRWFKMIPTPRRLKFDKRRRELKRCIDESIYYFISERKKEKRDDLLSLIIDIQRNAKNGDEMSDTQLRDEVVTLLMAGHETVANALAWAIYSIAVNPDIEAKLHRELAENIRGGASLAENLKSLKYTRAIFAETLRLYPPVWVIGRRAVVDDEIGGYRISAGSHVLASTWVTHRDPRYWGDPETFKPERFDGVDPMQDPSLRYIYYPFVRGPHFCIGEPIAWLEGMLVISTLAQRYKFRLVEGAKIEMEPSITLRPKGGIPLRLNERQV